MANCYGLTYLGSDLVATLANLNVHYFPHPSLEPKDQLGLRVWESLGHQCELPVLSFMALVGPAHPAALPIGPSAHLAEGPTLGLPCFPVRVKGDTIAS